MLKFKRIGLLLWSVCATVVAEAQKQPLEFKNIGEPAPALHISKWLKGGSIAEFKKGQVYVIEFWATWCQPCIAGMPHLSELARKHQKDVTVIGVSVMERNETTIPVIEKFVSGMGDKMDYNVAAEAGKLMADNWLKAFGHRGIPVAFVVDRQGRIAWIGLPKSLDKVLPQVIASTWDIEKAAVDRKESRRLTEIDNNLVVTSLNPFMGNPGNPQEALKKIDELLAIHPGLRYYHKTAHYTIYSLVKLNSEKVVDYYNKLKTSTDDPPFKSVTDAVFGKAGLKPEIYRIAADAYQEQLNRYPWSMDFGATYKSMADLYEQAGDAGKAADLRDKASKVPAKESGH